MKNLKRLPSGEYWFDLAMAFTADDMAEVNRVFADFLSRERSKRRKTVQASQVKRSGVTRSQAVLGKSTLVASMSHSGYLAAGRQKGAAGRPQPVLAGPLT